jgi:hypothetical protein
MYITPFCRYFTAPEDYMDKQIRELREFINSRPREKDIGTFMRLDQSHLINQILLDPTSGSAMPLESLSATVLEIQKLPPFQQALLQYPLATAIEGGFQLHECGLSGADCDAVLAFTTRQHPEISRASMQTDAKVDLSLAQLRAILSPAVVAHLQALFGGRIDSVILRRTVATGKLP